MLWACLRFSDLPFSAVFDDEAPTGGTNDAGRSRGASLPGIASSPRALHDGARQRPTLLSVNAAAYRTGVRVGHTVATARACCTALEVRARDAGMERQLLELLANWAYGYSGEVSIASPDALLLEVGASLKLFGGWPALERRLRGDLAALGHVHALALAPAPAAARVLARCADGLAFVRPARLHEALAQVPLPLSGLADNAVATLLGAGLKSLRDVFALPRPELGRRIGPDGLRHLDLLRGDVAETLLLYRPPDRFARRIELDHHVDSWLPLQFPLRRLTRDLALFLAARDGGVQRFELVLEHDGRAATRVPVNLLAPQREAVALFEFCRGRLERVAIAAEVSAIALVASDLPVFRPRHRDLFEVTREQALEWPDLAERLRARLGEGALRDLSIAAEHRPERAQATAKRRSETQFRPRPLWLLPRPIPLRPAPRRLLAGPERIESGWWDGADARRDYYVVAMPGGQRAWAFVPVGASSGWMLHGWFA